jgi:hypothetical protein
MRERTYLFKEHQALVALNPVSPACTLRASLNIR